MYEYCALGRLDALVIVQYIRDGKNANFSLSLVIVILIFKNRYLLLFTLLKIVSYRVSYFIIIVISIVMSHEPMTHDS